MRLMDSAFLDHLQRLVFAILPGETKHREEHWRQVVEDFLNWRKLLGTELSEITERLELLRRLEAAFPASDLRTNSRIVDLILANAAQEGDVIADHQGGQLRIIHRQISDRFGILYLVEDEHGRRLQREFFD